MWERGKRQDPEGWRKFIHLRTSSSSLGSPENQQWAWSFNKVPHLLPGYQSSHMFLVTGSQGCLWS